MLLEKNAEIASKEYQLDVRELYYSEGAPRSKQNSRRPKVRFSLLMQLNTYREFEIKHEELMHLQGKDQKYYMFRNSAVVLGNLNNYMKTLLYLKIFLEGLRRMLIEVQY